MKTQKCSNSIKGRLIIALMIGILILSGLLYLYHNQWNGIYIVNSIPTSITGVGIIIIISLTICTLFVIGGFLLAICFPYQPASEKKFTNLSDKLVNVAIKDFNSFPLTQFISRDDLSCSAKMDADGKISYSFDLKAKLYKTDDYELFLKHFDA